MNKKLAAVVANVSIKPDFAPCFATGWAIDNALDAAAKFRADLVRTPFSVWPGDSLFEIFGA
jgi:hypothetical protein